MAIPRIAAAIAILAPAVAGLSACQETKIESANAATNADVNAISAAIPEESRDVSATIDPRAMVGQQVHAPGAGPPTRP